MLKLYKYREYFGRMGTLEGLFIEDDARVEFIMGREVHLGEALGKYSDVWFSVTPENCYALDVSPDTVAELYGAVGSVVSGCNLVVKWADNYHDRLYDELWDDDGEPDLMQDETYAAFCALPLRSP